MSIRRQCLLFVAVSAVGCAQTFTLGTFAASKAPATGTALTGGSVDAGLKALSANSSITGLMPSGRNTARGAANGDAAWKQAGADEGLRQAFEQARYSLKESGDGTWRGENPAQGLTLEFTDGEARLNHPQGSVAFHLTGYGYGDRLRTPANVKPIGRGNRLEYRRGDLTEWYVNGSRGLEQGFNLAQRPGTARGNESLVISLSVRGGLVPARGADEISVQLVSDEGVVLRCTGLKTVDAGGRVVPSRSPFHRNCLRAKTTLSRTDLIRLLW